MKWFNRNVPRKEKMASSPYHVLVSFDFALRSSLSTIRPLSAVFRIETMNKKRQLTELTLWLVALVVAIVLTGFGESKDAPARSSSASPSVQDSLLR